MLTLSNVFLLTGLIFFGVGAIEKIIAMLLTFQKLKTLDDAAVSLRQIAEKLPVEVTCQCNCCDEVEQERQRRRRDFDQIFGGKDPDLALVEEESIAASNGSMSDVTDAEDEFKPILLLPAKSQPASPEAPVETAADSDEPPIQYRSLREMLAQLASERSEHLDATSELSDGNQADAQNGEAQADETSAPRFGGPRSEYFNNNLASGSPRPEQKNRRFRRLFRPSAAAI